MLPEGLSSDATVASWVELMSAGGKHKCSKGATEKKKGPSEEKIPGWLAVFVSGLCVERPMVSRVA